MRSGRNILRAAGVLPLEEQVKKSAWKQFMHSHLTTIHVVDFLTTEV